MNYTIKSSRRTAPEIPPIICITDPLPENNNVLRGFLRRAIIKLNKHYREKFVNYRHFLESTNGPMYYPLLQSVLRDNGVNPSEFNLITCIYYLGQRGRHFVRFKRIQMMNGTKHSQTYHLLSESITAGLITKQRTPMHPDGRSYQLLYRGHELFERVSKEFYLRLMELDD